MFLLIVIISPMITHSKMGWNMRRIGNDQPTCTLPAAANPRILSIRAIAPGILLLQAIFTSDTSISSLENEVQGAGCGSTSGCDRENVVECESCGNAAVRAKGEEMGTEVRSGETGREVFECDCDNRLANKSSRLGIGAGTTSISKHISQISNINDSDLFYSRCMEEDDAEETDRVLGSTGRSSSTPFSPLPINNGISSTFPNTV